MSETVAEKHGFNCCCRHFIILITVIGDHCIKTKNTTKLWNDEPFTFSRVVLSPLTRMRPVQERRMLAVYLHHDNSVLTNVFCTQVLCADAVVGNNNNAP